MQHCLSKGVSRELIKYLYPKSFSGKSTSDITYSTIIQYHKTNRVTLVCDCAHEQHGHECFLPAEECSRKNARVNRRLIAVEGSLRGAPDTNRLTRPFHDHRRGRASHRATSPMYCTTVHLCITQSGEKCRTLKRLRTTSEQPARQQPPTPSMPPDEWYRGSAQYTLAGGREKE